jgi:hypothetical protein
VYRNHDTLAVVLRIRPGAGALLAFSVPSAGANRLAESGRGCTPWFREPELPAGCNETLAKREQRLHVSTLIEDVGGEYDRKSTARGCEERRARVAPVHPQRVGRSPDSIEGVERTERERFGSVIGDEQVGCSSQRGDGRHAKTTTKLQDTLTPHDLGMTRDFRREGDTAGPQLRPVRKVLLGVGGGVIDEPVIIDWTGDDEGLLGIRKSKPVLTQ